MGGCCCSLKLFALLVHSVRRDIHSRPTTNWEVGRLKQKWSYFQQKFVQIRNDNYDFACAQCKTPSTCICFPSVFILFSVLKGVEHNGPITWNNMKTLWKRIRGLSRYLCYYFPAAPNSSTAALNSSESSELIPRLR